MYCGPCHAASGVNMPITNDSSPALLGDEDHVPDQSPGSRGRIRLTRETLVVRGLQVLLGLALLALWQLAADLKWPDPVLAKSPVQSWGYLVSAARSGELWSNTWATMTAVLIAW